MKDFQFSELDIKIIKKNSEITMKWLGKSRDKEVSIMLNDYLKEAAKELTNESIIIDLLELQSISSSTFIPIVDFINKLERANIKGQLIFNKSSQWQSAIFKMIENVTKNHKNISVVWK